MIKIFSQLLLESDEKSISLCVLQYLCTVNLETLPKNPINLQIKFYVICFMELLIEEYFENYNIKI